MTDYRFRLKLKDDGSLGFRLWREFHERDIRIYQAADRLDITSKTLIKVISGKKGVSPRLILRIILDISKLTGNDTPDNVERLRLELLKKFDRHQLLKAWKDEVARLCRDVRWKTPTPTKSMRTVVRKIRTSGNRALITYQAALDDVTPRINHMPDEEIKDKEIKSNSRERARVLAWMTSSRDVRKLFPEAV